MLPSGPIVSPSTLPVAAGSVASTLTSPRFQAFAGPTPTAPTRSASAAAAILNRVMLTSPRDFDIPKKAGCTGRLAFRHGRAEAKDTCLGCVSAAPPECLATVGGFSAACRPVQEPCWRAVTDEEGRGAMHQPHRIPRRENIRPFPP